jgi:hypothetical protein
MQEVCHEKPECFSDFEIDGLKLSSIIDYRDGKIFWKISPAKWIPIGTEAGNVGKHGYRELQIFGKRYLAHRLIYALHHGNMPDVIDHVDRNPLNNDISNLRASDKRLNAYNSGLPSNNKSGVRGVSWCKKNNKWVVRFKLDGKYLFLGYYEDLQSATRVRKQYEELHVKHKER